MMRRQYGYYFYLKIKNSKHGEVGTVLSRFRLRPTKSPQSIFHPCEFLLPSSVHSYTKQSIYRLIYHPCKFLLPSSFSSRYYSQFKHGFASNSNPIKLFFIFVNLFFRGWQFFTVFFIRSYIFHNVNYGR